MTLHTDDPKLKRLYMRSIRRGTKEMDLILGGFAQAALPSLSPDALASYDRLLGENDHDIYAWVLGQADAPAELSGIIETIKFVLKTDNFPEIQDV